MAAPFLFVSCHGLAGWVRVSERVSHRSVVTATDSRTDSRLAFAAGAGPSGRRWFLAGGVGGASKRKRERSHRVWFWVSGFDLIARLETENPLAVRSERRALRVQLRLPHHPPTTPPTPPHPPKRLFHT